MAEEEANPIIISCVPLAKEVIVDFLKEESFPLSDAIVNGLLGIVNQVSDYYEEGEKLFPEVIVMNDISILKMVQARTEEVYCGPIDDHSFPMIMKLCAPLARNNWSIFLNIVNENRIQYGLVSGELKESSLSLRRQILELTPKVEHVIYIRNIGSKNVEFQNTNKTCIVSLSLDDIVKNQDDKLNELVTCALSDVPKDKMSDILFAFMHKTIEDALNEGHGNLIVVCKESELSVCLKEMSGGAIIKEPIDIPLLLEDDRTLERNTTSVAIKSYVSLIKSMINHDGITFCSTTGKILAYHSLVSTKNS